ncbi:hypothetical protein KOR42_47190 [Thalassoglobus neptunius]|uniref:DUF1585 domain-containing protein n=1 Tax=Thalassoglobus neptunius TaxID=1938619 RepID=A0A5C5VWD8_9PLAN|nr:hypothetical protein KOR42_47190 [Thalassoglobus neptunius]
MYALGRQIRIMDRSQVDTIVEALSEHGYGLRDLVERIVSSDAFAESVDTRVSN